MEKTIIALGHGIGEGDEEPSPVSLPNFAIVLLFCLLYNQFSRYGRQMRLKRMCDDENNDPAGDDWTNAAFEKDQTELVIKGLAAGEYEVQVRAFVDNTDASVPERHRLIEYGKYGDIHTVIVP